MDAFMRRGRPDLANLALALPPELARDKPTELVASVSAEGRAVVVRRDGNLVIPQPLVSVTGMSPLGLAWGPATGPWGLANDDVWRRWFAAYLRAWLAATASGPLTFERGETRWTYQGRCFDRLIEALESVEVPAGAEAVLPCSDRGVPTTGLGFINVVRDAADAGLSALTLWKNGCTAYWSDGRTSHGIFMEALTLPASPGN